MTRTLESSNLTRDHKSTDGTHFRDLKGFTNNCFPDDFLRTQDPTFLHSIFHFFHDHFVDSGEDSFYLINFCLLTLSWRRADVKSDDEAFRLLQRVTSDSLIAPTQVNDGSLHTFHFNLLRGWGFNRTLYIGFNDDINRFRFPSLPRYQRDFQGWRGWLLDVVSSEHVWHVLHPAWFSSS